MGEGQCGCWVGGLSAALIVLGTARARADESPPEYAPPVPTYPAPGTAPPSAPSEPAPYYAPAATPHTLDTPAPSSSSVSDSAPHWAMPADAAARHTPFLNSTTGAIAIGNRFASPLYVGAELGAFHAARFRGSLRAVFPFGVAQARGELKNREYQSLLTDKPALLYGAALGFTLYTGYGFVLSTTANFMRADVGAFGNIIGLGLPFEWVSQGGVRVGFEFGLLRAFGGEVLGRCGPEHSFTGQSQADFDCDLGEVRAFNRDSGGGVWMHLILGIPYETPEPHLVSATP